MNDLGLYQGVYFGKRSGSIVTANGQFIPGNGFSSDDYLKEDASIISLGDRNIVTWGEYNDKPIKLLQLLKDSNIAPALLSTKIDFAVGEKLYFYKEEIQFDEKTNGPKIIKRPFLNERLSDWLEEIDAKTLIRKRATDYYFGGNVFSRIVLARDPEKYGVAYIDHVDACGARLEEISKKSRKIEHAYISDDWENPIYNQKDIAAGNTRRYKMFDPKNPLKSRVSLSHNKIYWPGQIYYGVQPWHSAHNWIGFANKIPVWMDSNISNSYNIKYHIKYPHDYFSYTKSMSKEDAKKERERVFDQVDRWLAGELNAGKTFYSKRILDPMTGKESSSWVIEPIKNDLKDKSFLEAYKTSQGALSSGWDLNPALANIPSEGKFTTSGSELRIAYQIHIALKTPAARSIMLQTLEDAYKVNHALGVPGFEEKDLKFGIINRNIVTLAENPAGMSEGTQNFS